MPTTVGRPAAGNTFLHGWVQAHGEAERIRVYGEPEEPDLPAEPEEPAPRRITRTRESALAAIADAMGEDAGDLAAFDVADLVIEEPPPAYNGSGAAATNDADMDATLARSGTRDPAADSCDSSRAYRVREGDWRERNGLPRRRKAVPPSRTPEARRARHIATKAARLGVSIHDAERITQRRQARSR